jgi:pimeloyl-ACP methyl ester carboxylesterase
MEPNERIIRANGVDLCLQTFGHRANPTILLIMGGASSMDWWEDGFCERLTAGSRFVIRYDHRDTGRSISYEPGAAPYSLRDLAEDAVGLLDALGLESAHLVGMSVGGWIGQLVALDHPDRVASLTLISTSPTAWPGDPDLPEMSGCAGDVSMAPKSSSGPSTSSRLLRMSNEPSDGSGRPGPPASVCPDSSPDRTPQQTRQDGVEVSA